MASESSFILSENCKLYTEKTQTRVCGTIPTDMWSERKEKGGLYHARLGGYLSLPPTDSISQDFSIILLHILVGTFDSIDWLRSYRQTCRGVCLFLILHPVAGNQEWGVFRFPRIRRGDDGCLFFQEYGTMVFRSWKGGCGYSAQRRRTAEGLRLSVALSLPCHQTRP